MSQPPDEHEELVQPDDKIIGRATGWSLIALVAIASVAGVVIFILKQKPVAPPPRITQINAPSIPDKPKAEIPLIKFTDVTKEAGITFTHVNGAYGEKLLPETMGGGVAFFDFDNDGTPDLLFVNSTYWPGHVPAEKQPTTLALYHNDGRGHFTDATKGSGP